VPQKILGIVEFSALPLSEAAPPICLILLYQKADLPLVESPDRMEVRLQRIFWEKLGSRKGFTVSPSEPWTEGGRRQGSGDPILTLKPGGNLGALARFLPSPSLNG